jgi:hypothetical protein
MNLTVTHPVMLYLLLLNEKLLTNMEIKPRICHYHSVYHLEDSRFFNSYSLDLIQELAIVTVCIKVSMLESHIGYSTTKINMTSSVS